jgi:hypothetical protein
VHRVVERLGVSNPYLLAYQSEVGPVRWQGPSTEKVIRRLGTQGRKRVLVVPIAFTSDHIETLSELDREYGELAHQVGITHYKRSPALNERPGSSMPSPISCASTSTRAGPAPPSIRCAALAAQPAVPQHPQSGETGGGRARVGCSPG